MKFILTQEAKELGSCFVNDLET